MPIYVYIVLFALLFSAQYTLCAKVGRKWFYLKLLPLAAPAGLAITAYRTLHTSATPRPSGNGIMEGDYLFMEEIYEALAFELYRCAAVGLAAIVLAWVVYLVRNRSR